MILLRHRSGILKKLLKKVIDRSELILDIFATRAKDVSGKTSGRTSPIGVHTTQVKEDVDSSFQDRGRHWNKRPRRKQLEVDKRIVLRKIHDLRKKLHEIEKRQERIVASRKEFFTVSIVGYTNAGKSTLMNALTTIDTFVEDKLFATLDTKTSICKLENGKRY